MSAIITEFDGRGDVKHIKETTFRFVGEGKEKTVEIQVGTSKTVEVRLGDIFDKIAEQHLKAKEKGAS